MAQYKTNRFLASYCNLLCCKSKILPAYEYERSKRLIISMRALKASALASPCSQ